MSSSTIVQPPKQSSPSVRLSGVGRRFGSTVALADVSLELRAGSINAFIGQNGAGKSTCCGVIAGRIAPGEGSITIDGSPYPATPTPISAQRAGVGAIYQELTTVPTMTALENVFIGSLETTNGVVRWKALRRRFFELAARLRVNIDPKARADTLSLADRQMLEIMRALALNSRVLILDEPTAPLSPSERSALFSVMRELRNDGVCLIWVSHFLDEVLEVSDNVSVFRDGRLVADAPTSTWTENSLISEMLGTERAELQREIDLMPSRRAVAQTVSEDKPRTSISVRGLSGGSVKNVDMELPVGEIIGLAGLVGSGRSTICRLLTGAQRSSSGEILIGDRRLPIPSSPSKSRDLGIAYTSEDRKRDGLFPSMAGGENIVAGSLDSLTNFGIVRRGLVSRLVQRQAQAYGIPQWMTTVPAAALSGGNQQKLLLARADLQNPKLLIADEPTRGIDIGAKSQILSTLRRFADHGGTVLLVSSDLEELAAASDRIHVLHKGRLTASLPHQYGRTDRILHAAFRVEGND